MRFYLQTKFRGNLRGSSIFCVDLAWNDQIFKVLGSDSAYKNPYLWARGSPTPSLSPSLWDFFHTGSSYHVVMVMNVSCHGNTQGRFMSHVYLGLHARHAALHCLTLSLMPNRLNSANRLVGC